MLEVQEERSAHFNKKKEHDEAKDGRERRSVSQRNPRTVQKAHASPHQHLSHSSVSSGSPSMHSSNPKVRNSPSANTQSSSSPKSKQEAMVRSPPVMSPSSAAQMDSKLPSQGKQGGTGGQSQPSPCDPKTLSGGHAPKGPQGATGSMGLKNGQGLNTGNGAKGKVKRERSTSADSFEQRDTGTPNNESELKDAGSRSKRMCVAERRQPYSGTDWCSGGESDEDEQGFFNCNSNDVKPQDSHSLPPSNAGISRSSTPSHSSVGGQNATSETTGSQKAPTKVVYVFSTEMANKAADAVIKGHSDSIVAYHMQNISSNKTAKSHLPVNNQLGPVRNESKPQQQQSSHPPERNQQVSKVQPSQQQQQPQPQPQQQQQGPKSGNLPQDSAGGMDNKSLPVSSPRNTTPHEGANPNSTAGNQSASTQGPQTGFLLPEVKGDLKITPQQQQQHHHQQLANEILSSMGENPEGLSQEQLEHRERSLQTLRDIQRMLFPDDRDFALKDLSAMGQGNAGAPPQNVGMMEGLPSKSDQGPLQAMMAQSQSLGKPPGQRQEGPPFGQPGIRDMPFSPDDLGPPPGPPMNTQPGSGSEHSDHMTPEQIAWLKLQQEFYEEKRRKQEQIQHRPMADMMLHQHGPRGMIRGPPPPYQMNPGEVWGPGGPEPFGDQMTLPPRGMPPHPMQRMPGFPGMMNPDMDGGTNAMTRPGMNWPEDMPKMGDGRGFPPGQGVFGGPGGRIERFSNPQAIQEGIFQQQMAEKQQLGLPPGMGMDNVRGPPVDINRMMANQRSMDPGSNGGGVMFPRMPGDGPMSPSRMDFVKGPGRDVEFGMGPGGMNMNMKVDMNLNVSMSSNSQMMGKMREAPMNMSPEEIMKMRQGSGPSEHMALQQKMLQAHQFPDQPQEFHMGPNRQFAGMPQGPGGMRGPRGEHPFGPEHRTNMGGNARLSHMPPLPLNQPQNSSNLNAGPSGNPRNLARKPSDLGISAGQVNSPNVNPLKSPTLRQVHSPMLGSPSTNLKSPQTPSQLAGMLSGPASVAAAAAAAAAASIKSPPVMGSAAASPVHLKSPSISAPSPGWTSSPKPLMQSPGIPQTSKPSLSMTSPSMMGNVEQGGPPSAPPSSGSYAMAPEPTLSQNPLSIMMSRMSKFAMPSSTPLYHDAIKTVASSDDDSPPARSPNLPPMNNMPGVGGNHHPNHPRMMAPNSTGHMPSLSPMGMNTVGSQPLSHGLPNQMHSPNPMGPNIPPHGGPMGPGMMPHNMMMHPGPQDPGLGNPHMLPQGRMGFPHGQQGFPPVQSPPQHVPFPHNGPGPGGVQGGFHHGMGFPGEGGPRLVNMPQGPGGDPGLCKPNAPGGPDSFNSMGNHMPSVYTDPNLQEVIRPGASGIPEFDLSRIMPSEKPSQTLSYFPRGDGPGRKMPHPSGPVPGFSQMQGMMGEQNPRMGLPMAGMGGPGHMGPQDMVMGNPAHNPMRPPGFMPQGMMGHQHRILSPGQTGMPGQPGMMGNPAMMQGKERGPVGLYNHPGTVGSPNMMMSLHGMGGPQQTMMMPSQMRPRGMAADVGMVFNQGPGNPGNMMF
ncbi:B-cell CLL/lymphoma 9 protein-like isoform X1 [Polyodon spathula]|uniref:B-cell CLL/lymphoma 9 protein-like isoform X1 n=1 Tax=Polyodon spathula TaxID=7913 RepID=UPI001B7F2F0E|nr:B-cell CLL/lymphoma 9 protein-like isoform X1 [Polyodon spathula]XP_041115310.1 B-cell CLL/lymphoma 9 protein-like isoform X1 [Polyodon spathula]